MSVMAAAMEVQVPLVCRRQEVVELEALAGTQAMVVTVAQQQTAELDLVVEVVAAQAVQLAVLQAVAAAVVYMAKVLTGLAD